MALVDSIVRCLDIAAIAVNSNGECDANEKAQRFLGLYPGNQEALVEVLGNGFKDTPSGELAEALEAAKGGRELQLELTWTSGQTSERVKVDIGRVGGSDGAVLILIASPRRAQLEALQAERLERLASIGQLSAGVTHELNNVLTAILGWTQIALRDPTRVARVESALSIVDDSSRRAKEIIDDVLSIARGEHGSGGRVKLAELADEVFRVLSWELNNCEITVVRRYLDSTTLQVDRRKLFQVFLNVVLNAIQAMPEGGEIRVEVRFVDGQAEIEFRDSGHGMSESTLAKIFEPHFTTKTRSADTGGGSGLGLAISQKFIDEIGGDIHAESTPGGGAAFTITLAADHVSTMPGPANAARSSDLIGGLSILVVENEPPIRQLLAEALEEADVAIATQGIEALALCRRQRFDVALIDYTMPGASGRYLTNQLRELLPALRIVFMSGRPDEIDIEAAGADAFLKKPFELDDLKAALIDAAHPEDDAIDE